MIWEIEGYWVDTGRRIDGYRITDNNHIADNEDIFFLVEDEQELIEMVAAGAETQEEFVVVDYEEVDDA